MARRLPYRDPELPDMIRELHRSRASITQLSKETKLSQGCISRIKANITRHPRHITMVRIWGALGYRYTLLKEEGSNVVELKRRRG